MNRHFFKLAAFWGAAHLLTVLAMDFLIFALSHLPPEHFDFSGPIRLLSTIYAILIHPRQWLRWLWPSEHTPRVVIYAVMLGNSLLWGAACVALGRWWQSLLQRHR